MFYVFKFLFHSVLFSNILEKNILSDGSLYLNRTLSKNLALQRILSNNQQNEVLAPLIDFLDLSTVPQDKSADVFLSQKRRASGCVDTCADSSR